ncbi:sensor histidine kinase [Agromyces marinus]|uniref:Signal transduction histidine kinase n=1 Tax=Agromyces marinus TaxID=1389020 RepID=A0ABM8H2U9_9MICO|nr:histidine kinase [Agromyces marinus]UIP59823.1 Sensor histidine kinase YpdA [Agromyces marinus]BDZ55092.1 signal transduction histidine kinase [Agromyces marinus]
MSESMLLAAAVGVVAGALAVGVVVLLRRLATQSKELGTDAERATYETLHLASRAAKHLRGDMTETDAARAAKHLRALLEADTLALVVTGGPVAVDGDETLVPAAERLAEGAVSSGRTRVERRVPTQWGETDAAAAPILADGVPVGAVVAFAGRARAGLVRATGEVAEWVAAQVELGELDASRTALAELEVRALRAQISPHFIYNSLNAIASFINTDPAKARELVLEFADFTRYSFRRHGDFTTVAEELRSIDSYLRLERARFGDRLTVTLQVAPEVLSTVVPFLSIQPLVENAVRHGLEAKEEGGRITITAEDVGGFAEISVEDDGVGIDPEAAAAVLAGGTPGEHVGLRNVDARLRQVYGDEHGLVVETNVGAGTLVRMRVPKSQPGRSAASVDARANRPAEPDGRLVP